MKIYILSVKIAYFKFFVDFTILKLETCKNFKEIALIQIIHKYTLNVIIFRKLSRNRTLIIFEHLQVSLNTRKEKISSKINHTKKNIIHKKLDFKF